MVAILNWQIVIHIDLHIGGKEEDGDYDDDDDCHHVNLITHYLSDSSFFKFLFFVEAVNDVKCL